MMRVGRTSLGPGGHPPPFLGALWGRPPLYPHLWGLGCGGGAMTHPTAHRPQGLLQRFAEPQARFRLTQAREVRHRRDGSQRMVLPISPWGARLTGALMGHGTATATDSVVTMKLSMEYDEGSQQGCPKPYGDVAAEARVISCR